MKKLALMSWEHTTLTSFALILFLGFFVGVLYWVFKKENKNRFRDASRMPLDDGRISHE